MTRKDKLYIELINKMFEIAGHDCDFEKAKSIPEFYLKYSMTQEQQDKWFEYGIKRIKLKLGYSQFKSEKLMDMINLNHGLTLSGVNA